MKAALDFLRRHRNALSAVGVCLTVICIFWVTNAPAVIGASATERRLPIYCVKRDNKCVSLTFDAAWGNEDTQELIDILSEYDAGATFFVVGEWVDKYPESVKALHDAGHEIMNHSDTHAHFAALSAEGILAELQACNAKIASVTGTEPTLFRCPYGEYDDHVVAAVESAGMLTIQWDVETLERV